MNNYERTRGHVLLINGQDYRQVVVNQWILYEEQKENEKLQRVIISEINPCRMFRNFIESFSKENVRINCLKRLKVVPNRIPR